MPESEPQEFRLYCICGQKMRVSPAMFGRPGKCVACRQRIRIPRRDEIPAGVTEFYLKDHPEFLRRRKNGRRIVQEIKHRPEESRGGAPAEFAPPVALDILEPLRVVCSLEHKIQRQIEAMSAPGAPELEGLDRVTLQGYLDRVQEARSGLDEQVRQRMMETDIEIAGTQEKIAQVGLSARIGEVDFDTFYQTTDQLRRRRDALERIQQNLRGWLATSGPHAAGGYANVSLESIPKEGFQLVLSADVADARPLLNQHIEELREAFLRRERAEVRLSETTRLKAEAAMDAAALADCRADSEAELQRANAEIAYRRHRLEQLSTDGAADVQVFEACLDRIRKEADGGTLDKGRYHALQRRLVTAQRDSAKAHDLASRALIAGSAGEVPFPKGTFLKRMPRPAAKTRPGAGLDSWLAWASALTMGLSVFLPAVGDLSPIAAYQTLGARGDLANVAMALPILAGLLVTLFAAVARPRVRGIGLAVLWLAVTLAGAVFIHEAQYAAHPIAVRFRQGGPWVLRPGMLLLMFADLGVYASAWAALARQKKGRALMAGVTAAAAITVAAVSTDFAGYFRPRPAVVTSWEQQAGPAGVLYDVSISVENGGRRDLMLTSAQSNARNAFSYVFERQHGIGWEVVGRPDRVEGARDSGYTLSGDARTLYVRPGEAVTFRYRLPYGKYRARVSHNAQRIKPVTAHLELEAPTGMPVAPVESLPLVEEPAAPPAVGADEAPDAALAPAPPRPVPGTAAVEVELRGVLVSAGRPPRFSITRYLRGEPPDNLDVTIGDSIRGSWVVSEFNPTRQTVVLSNGVDLLVLNRGQRIPLE